MGATDLEAWLPRLKSSGYKITSDSADRPNCIGWVLDSPFYFDPQGRGLGGYFWPDGAPEDDSVSAWREMFMHCFGYQPCDDADVEPGTDKIAIYSDDEGKAGHVARQLPTGQWTSKLGKLEDISHTTLDALISPAYTAVVAILKKPRTT